MTIRRPCAAALAAIGALILAPAVPLPANPNAPLPGAAGTAGPVRPAGGATGAPRHRRALLVGIDRYVTAAPALGSRAAQRNLHNLAGAVADVEAMRELLVSSRFGFAPADVTLLTDAAATRKAILRAIEERLVQPARPGDVELFYFSGHGSQVLNRLSDERDQLDESLVPADSAAEAEDIRDKELRRLFNRLLDRGARLTVVADSCHSGSIARGLADGEEPRGILPDIHVVADGAALGPKPEDRGALVLSATQDFSEAWEARDERQQLHGAFSLALLWALRDGAAGELAEDTYARARARLKAGRRYQEPVIAGNLEARRTPFLGTGPVAGGRGQLVPAAVVEQVESDGTVLLAGGWANGLTPGSVLRPAAPHAAPQVRLEITEMLGLDRARARPATPAARADVPPAFGLAAGTRLELVRWAVPPGAPLRVWIPEASGKEVEAAAALAAKLRRAMGGPALQWLSDPTVAPPGPAARAAATAPPRYLLRWRQRLGWELLGATGVVRCFAAGAAPAAILAALPGRAALFVQLPADRRWVAAMGIGAGTEFDAVDKAAAPADAAYILTGRLAGDHLEYAWIRPGMTDGDRSVLPVRSDWIAAPAAGAPAGTAQPLATAILALRKVHDWTFLEAPPGGAGCRFRLRLRDERTRELVRDPALAGGEVYRLLLEDAPGAPARQERWVYAYVFSIDRFGKSVLLFPTDGPVENRFSCGTGGTVGGGRPELDTQSLFKVVKPLGMDTFYLLLSQEQIGDPWVLEWDGVRTRGPLRTSPLEELLSVTGGGSRALQPVVVPATWSVERQVFDTAAGAAVRP